MLLFLICIALKFGVRGQLADVITCVKFLVDRFRGYGVLISPKLPFPIDLLRRPYNSVRTAVRDCDKAWRNSATTNPIHKSVGYNQPPTQPIRTLMNVTQYPLRFRVPKSVLRWISLTRIVNRGIDYARDWPELFANGRKYARMIRYRGTSSPKHPATESVAADHYQSSFASS